MSLSTSKRCLILESARTAYNDVERREVKQLGGRCESLLTGLKEASNDKAPEKMQDVLKNTEQFVQCYFIRVPY